MKKITTNFRFFDKNWTKHQGESSKSVSYLKGGQTNCVLVLQNVETRNYFPMDYSFSRKQDSSAF